MSHEFARLVSPVRSIARAVAFYALRQILPYEILSLSIESGSYKVQHILAWPVVYEFDCIYLTRPRADVSTIFRLLLNGQSTIT